MEEKANTKIISLELLRIMSMLMIVILHFLAYTKVSIGIEPFSFLYFAKTIVGSLCAVSVNCFILISGYFALKSKFKVKKIIEITLEVVIYSAFIYFLLLFTGKIKFEFKELILSFFPVLTRQYWFITTYVGVYIFSPVIRFAVNKMNKLEHIISIIIGFFLFVAYYNVFFFCDNLNFGGATGIVWFSYLYLCGTYLYRYYKPDYNFKKNISRFIFMELISLLSFVPFWILYFITKNELFIKGASIFDSVYNSIFVFIDSIFLFIAYLNIKNESLIKYEKKIYFLSSSALACYLIHENKYIRDILWNFEVFNTNRDIINFFILLFFVPICVYLIACIFDKMRSLIFKLIFSKKICLKIDEFQNKVKETTEKKLKERFNIDEVEN